MASRFENLIRVCPITTKAVSRILAQEPAINSNLGMGLSSGKQDKDGRFIPSHIICSVDQSGQPVIYEDEEALQKSMDKGEFDFFALPFLQIQGIFAEQEVAFKRISSKEKLD